MTTSTPPKTPANESIGSRIKAAGQLAAKQAQRVKIATITLPGAYRALGKHLYSAKQYRDEFVDLYKQFDELAAELKAIKQQAAARHATEGFTAKAKSGMTPAKDIAQSKTLELKTNQAFTELGKNAFAKFGTESGPAEIVQPVAHAQAQVAMLDAEISALTQTRQGQFLSSKRLVIGGVAAVLLIGLTTIFRSSTASSTAIEKQLKKEQVTASEVQQSPAPKVSTPTFVMPDFSKEQNDVLNKANSLTKQSIGDYKQNTAEAASQDQAAPKMSSVAVMPKETHLLLKGQNLLAPVELDLGNGYGRWAFINKSGETVLELGSEISEAREFSEGLAAVCLGGRWGFVNAEGRMVIPPQFGRVGNFSEGLAVVDGTKFIDRTGKIVISGDFSQVFDFHEGMAAFFPPGLGTAGFIDKSGSIKLRPGPEEHACARYFSEGLVPWYGKGNLKPLYGNGKITYRDTEGRILVELAQTNRWLPFSEGLAAICVPIQDPLQSSAVEFIDTSGTVRISPNTDWDTEDFGSFHDGVAAVKEKLRGQWGFIDTNGKTVIAFQFSNTDIFSDGRCAASKDGNWRFIDKTGQEVGDTTYKPACWRTFSQGMAGVRPTFSGPWGFIDTTGKVVVPAKFKDVGEFTNISETLRFLPEKRTHVGVGL